MNLFNTGGELYPMRWYQEPAMPMFRDAIRAHHTKMIGQAPCGWGKTVLAAHIFASALQKGSRCLFACPRISLVDQTVESFERQGISDIGVMQGNHPRTDYKARLQVACFDTLYRRDFVDFDLAVIDEVHMADARMWDLVKMWKLVLGLTATPWTKGLGLHFSELLVFSTLADMIGYNEKDPSIGLVPVRGKGPNFALLAGLSEIKTGDDGEYQEKPAAAFMDRKEVVADVVETWLKTKQEGNHPGNRTFLFAPTRVNARTLQEAFAAQGVTFEYIDAYTDNRSPIFRRFHNLEIEGIVSVGCLTTGVDADVRCVSDAALSNSESTIVQKIGRGMRPAQGKEYLWLNDHTGNANRFGWFADIFHAVLDRTPPQIMGSAYQNEEAAPRDRQQKQCDRCRTMVKRGALTCTACGHKIVIDDIVTIKAELTDLEHTKGKEKQVKATMDDKQAFYSRILGLALERGKDLEDKLTLGWAAHRYKEKYGVWPNQLKRTPMTPNPEIRTFDQSRRIAYHKAKQKPKVETEAYQSEF